MSYLKRGSDSKWCNYDHTEAHRRSQNLKISKMGKMTGIIWDKKHNKWISRIIYNKKTKELGRFDNREDAIIARLLAEKEIYGDKAPHASLFKQYKIN